MGTQHFHRGLPDYRCCTCVADIVCPKTSQSRQQELISAQLLQVMALNTFHTSQPVLAHHVLQMLTFLPVGSFAYGRWLHLA